MPLGHFALLIQHFKEHTSRDFAQMAKAEH